MIARAPGVIAERLFDETVLLDPQSDRYVRLNGTGTLLWEALAQPTQLSELTRQLEAKFGPGVERAGQDVVSFVRQLAERGLIELDG